MDPIRREIARVCKKAFARRAVFASIKELDIPPLTEMLKPRVGDVNALEVCKAYYLSQVMQIYGYGKRAAFQRIARKKKAAFQNARKLNPRVYIGDVVQYRAACLRQAKKVLREEETSIGYLVRIGDLLTATPRGFRSNCSFGAVVVECADRSTHLRFTVRFPSLDVELHTDLVFCLWLDRYLTFTEPDLFAERLRNVVHLHRVFLNELRKNTDDIDIGVSP